MTPDRLQEIMEEARALISEHLGIRAPTFRRAVARAGRLLPPQARQAATQLLELDRRIQHPKLAARTDPAMAEQALASLNRQLRSIEPGKRQAQARAFFWAEIGFRAALVLALLVTVLVWRGYL
ncbi:hypothetical protein E2K80_09710 [Rhodophyticola sp. CCM32]|uniref:hypothetical protein n=1 Tax=Rhodophyticola sp. CCM32 TaxID=2916397 RepID=UPI00107F45C6|nr:hypothetical protein [Rhodophyticola sp. CCM32]QBY00969.1 hypothetical protein E2K80_09710 [Rhodophyticola sp. CCM32]